MYKNIILATTIFAQASFGSSKLNSDIKEWKEITIKKGYILSIDLHQEQKCSKIWSKQIKEFKKMNPHIKNPDVLLVNQKIKVQSCKVEITEVSDKNEKKIQNDQLIENKPQWFFEAFAGVSSLGSTDTDTSKSGKSLGVKIGQNFLYKQNELSLSLGYLRNDSKTKNDNDKLGVYEITTHLITFEGAFHIPLTQKWSFGPELMMATGNDVSMSDNNQSKNLGIFGGLDLLYKIKSGMSIKLNVDQRIDDLSRSNVLTNLGIKINF